MSNTAKKRERGIRRLSFTLPVPEGAKFVTKDGKQYDRL